MFKRILVTGATGFMGHHIAPRLKEAWPEAELVAVGRKDYDLLQPGEPDRMIRDVQPDAVVHLAAKSGGIITNKKRPADFFYENLVMNTHTLHAAFQNGVKKLLTLMGGCSYPSKAISPIGEDQMWNGYPQIESAGYSVAKKMLLVQSWAYRVQHGFNSVVLIPGNVYGEWDNFNLEESHVIPALLRKYIEAGEQGKNEVMAYGSGRPTRDFVYAGDVAATIPWFLKNYDSSDPVNISSGTRITIRELTESIAEVTGFQGRIAWDATKPDGQMDKIFDVRRLHELGLSCPTPLKEGLARTADWFRSARQEGTVRL
ncbi:MAG TPA: GDP-fucose synthetase [Verrucomicrobia bacterium]|nr:MAG: GDP-fucose synthetase [Lentisphaerae bacterium GWF2_57_35]HBA82618.1 GDP-fucose synthetase [Verrucomicrobiota bacterium]